MIKTWEPYECEEVCQDQATGRWKANERASRGCRRADLPAVEPDVYMPRLLHYMGRHPDPDLEASYWPGLARMRMGSKVPWWRRPPEDWRDGCPGSWIRSPFCWSFSKYARRRDSNGGRVQNHKLDRCDDWLIEDAVLHFEREEERRIAYHEKQIYEAREAKMKAAKR